MTAEVAIINRIAVTLAADSAMTLSGDMPDKIYNSADKIFELSHHDPLALMVYNNLEYAGYPIDVAIKSFRTSSLCRQFSTIDQAVEAFFSYIASLPISKESETNHVKQISYILFEQISREFIRVVEKDAGKNLRRQNPRIDLHQMFTDVCLKGRKSLEVRERIATLSDVTVAMLEDEYATSIDEVSSNVFENLPLNDEDKQLLRSVVHEAILSNYFSRNYSGLVFSGYVAQQMFPSMRAFEVDGIFLGRIKRRCTETLEIDQNGNTAAIIPFAQKEMVDRFIFGIDPDFAAAIPSYMSDQILKIGEEIIRNFGRINKSKKKALLDKVNEAAAVAAASFTEDALEEIKLMKRNEILDVLRFMPKKELADFAESLVYITSIKRKFSSEQETVGGPIDVAVISRSDGFVWVKRKHYFDNALNPRYFYRKFGVSLPSERS